MTSHTDTRPPEATLQAVKDVLRANAEELIDFTAKRFAHLGARLEWDSEDNFEVTETLAEYWLLSGVCRRPPAWTTPQHWPSGRRSPSTSWARRSTQWTAIPLGERTPPLRSKGCSQERVQVHDPQGVSTRSARPASDTRSGTSGPCSGVTSKLLEAPPQTQDPSRTGRAPSEGSTNPPNAARKTRLEGRMRS